MTTNIADICTLVDKKREEVKTRSATTSNVASRFRRLLLKALEQEDLSPVQGTLTKHAQFFKRQQLKPEGRSSLTVNIPLDKDENTLLHLAIIRNQVELVNAILSSLPGVNVNAVNFRNATPLHVACALGHTRICVLLLLHPTTDKRVVDRQGMEPIHVAVKYNRTQTLRTLIQLGYSIDSSSSVSRQTPLHLAARYGHKDIVEWLLKLGANAHARDRQGQTPLMICARSPVPRNEDNACEVWKMLIKVDPDWAIESTDRYGRNCVFLAVLSSNVSFLETLGKEISNCRRRYHRALSDAVIRCDLVLGTTPLHLASHNGHIETLKALISFMTRDSKGHRCKDIDQCDTRGITALQRVIQAMQEEIDIENEYLEFGFEERHEQAIHTLVSAGADVERVRQYLSTSMIHTVIDRLLARTQQDNSLVNNAVRSSKKTKKIKIIHRIKALSRSKKFYA